MKKQILFVYILTFSLITFSSCNRDDDEPEILEPISITCLNDNKIIISNISDIPDGLVFNKIKAKISGFDWQVIDIVEATYIEGKAILSLPSTFSAKKLQKVVSINDNDYSGFWRATTDNEDARVAGLNDIIAYNNDDAVGRIYLTDCTGQGSIIDKSFIYYHYSNQPFTLTGTYGSYFYDASFIVGWNSYANISRTEETQKGAIRCTTSIAEETPLVWHFESWVY